MDLQSEARLQALIEEAVALRSGEVGITLRGLDGDDELTIWTSLKMAQRIAREFPSEVLERGGSDASL